MKKFLSFIFVIAVTVVLTLAFSAAVLQPRAAAAPAMTAAPALPVAGVPEEHPHIHEALESMRAAKHHLESAEHDFDGHRLKSIEHLNKAIEEAEICMKMK